MQAEVEADRAGHDARAAAETFAHESPSSGDGAGHPLHTDVRQFFEDRLGYNFAGVRIHSDEKAAAEASSMHAHAYTRGEQIFFGKEQFNTRTFEGIGLLGHELAHVRQQAGPGSRIPYGVTQPKLLASGDIAGFESAANAILGPGAVVVAPDGTVSLKALNANATGEQQAFAASLSNIINDSKTTAVEFMHGTAPKNASEKNVQIGSYHLEKIDLDDIATLGSGPGGATSAAGLDHELVEQYQKQVHGQSYPTAHATAVGSTERVVGATRGTVTPKNIDATTTEVTTRWNYPDGTFVDVTMTVKDGNVVKVDRTQRKKP